MSSKGRHDLPSDKKDETANRDPSRARSTYSEKEGGEVAHGGTIRERFFGRQALFLVEAGSRSGTFEQRSAHNVDLSSMALIIRRPHDAHGAQGLTAGRKPGSITRPFATLWKRLQIDI